MGVNTDYLGRVDILPGLNQFEYDYLRASAYMAGALRADCRCGGAPESRAETPAT